MTDTLQCQVEPPQASFPEKGRWALQLPLGVKRLHSGIKKQPKEAIFRTDVPQTSGGHSGGHPQSKVENFMSDPANLGKTIMLVRTSMTWRRAHPWRQRRSKWLRAESFGLMSSSLCRYRSGLEESACPFRHCSRIFVQRMRSMVFGESELSTAYLMLTWVLPFGRLLGDPCRPRPLKPQHNRHWKGYEALHSHYEAIRSHPRLLPSPYQPLQFFHCRSRAWGFSCQGQAKKLSHTHKLKLLGPDSLRLGWGGGSSTSRGRGSKSSACPSNPRETNFGGISRDFSGISRAWSKSLRKNCAQILSPTGFPGFRQEKGT